MSCNKNAGFIEVGIVRGGSVTKQLVYPHSKVSEIALTLGIDTATHDLFVNGVKVTADWKLIGGERISYTKKSVSQPSQSFGLIEVKIVRDGRTETLILPSGTNAEGAFGYLGDSYNRYNVVCNGYYVPGSCTLTNGTILMATTIPPVVPPYVPARRFVARPATAEIAVTPSSVAVERKRSLLGKAASFLFG